VITTAAREKIADLLKVGGYTGVKICVSSDRLFEFTPFSGGTRGGIIVSADPLIVLDEEAILMDCLLIDYDVANREFVIRR